MAVDGSYSFDPATEKDSRSRRRRIAEQLMMQGMETSPIQSPWQGAARMAQALMGGIELGMEDKKERETLAAQNAYGSKLSEELAGFGGGGGGGSAVTSALAGKPMGGPIKLGGFEPTLGRTLEFEGGVNPNDSNGAPSVHGINAKANPDVDLERVKTDPAYRADIYRKRYWNTIDGDKLDPRVAHVAFDTSVIAGPGKARELLKASGGDPEKFLALREQFQNRLLAANPEKYGPYAKAWANRVATLRSDVGVGGGQPGGMMAVGGGSGDTTLAGGDTLQGRGAPDVGRLQAIATDPNAPQHIRERARLMLQSMPKPRDPLEEEARRIQVEKGRLELNKMRNPQAPPPPEAIQKLQAVGIDQPTMQAAIKDPAHPLHALVTKAIGGSGVTVNTNVSTGDKADGKFDEEMAKGQAKLFTDMATEGVAAKADTGQIRVLRETLARVPGGFGTGIQAMASSYGIKLGPNADAIEAAQAIIARLVPTQRAPGSGPMSDKDVDLFKSSLPSLLNTPNGNAIILDTMEGMAAYKEKQAEIATAVIDGDMTRKEAMKALRALPDPLAAVKAAAKDLPKSAPKSSPAPGSPPPGVDPQVWKYMTPEERALWK